MKRMFALLGSITLGIALTLGLFWGLPAIAAEEPSVEDEVWAQATKQQVVVDAALSWLRTQQADDGSFGGTEGITIDVVLALAAANEDPNTWTKNGNSPLDYLETRVAPYSNLNPASAGKLALGIIAADKDPYNFGGTNVISKVTGYYNPATGQYSNTTSSTTWDQALAMLTLSASFEMVPPTATARLKSLQQADGGWEFSASWGSDTNSTALAMEALIAAGEPATSIALVSATTYLSNTQIVTDAGFPYQNPNPWGPTESDAPSTAMAIQALIAREEDPMGATWTKGISTPFGTLLSFQSPAGGFKGFSGPNDLQSTAQGIQAVMGKPLPIRGRVMAAQKALQWTKIYQNNDGGFREQWGTDSSAGATADMVLAIAACGDDPNTWLKNGKSSMDYLATQAANYATYAGATGKLIVTVVAGKRTPESFGGMNLYTELQSFYDSNTGAYGSSVDDQAWAILALKAMGKPIPPVVVNRLKSMVNPNGSWTWWGDASYGTGMALMALKAAGEDPDSSFYFDEAYAYWRDTMQMNDGGFPQDNPNPWPPTESDTNSTSFVIIGLVAGGQNPDSWRWSKQLAAGEGITIPVNTPLDWLMRMQNASKAFGWTKSSSDDNFYSTRQAIPALMLETFPLVAEENKVYLPVILKDYGPRLTP